MHTLSKASERQIIGRRAAPSTSDNHNNPTNADLSASQAKSYQGLEDHTNDTSRLAQDDEDTNDEAGISDISARFVGDLNPEALFVAEKGSRSTSRLGCASVGTWLERHNEFKNMKRPLQEISHSARKTTLPPFLPCSLRAVLQSLEKECLSIVPSKEDFASLQSIYFSKVHPIWPIVTENSLDSHGVVKSIWLRQALSIMVSTDPIAQAYLRLPESDKRLSRLEFSERLAAVVKVALDMGFITDKKLLIQVTALLSFYIEGINGSEDSARYCSAAVHHAQNIGLHLTRPQNCSKEEEKERLFFCVWALDRLNAAFNGRATLIHNWDIGMNLVECFRKEQVPSFRVFLEICLLLDKAIGLYRPVTYGASEISGASILTFEDIVVKCDAFNTDNAILGRCILVS